MSIDYQYLHFDTVRGDQLGKPKTFANGLKFFDGKEIEIVVRRKRAKRSLQQNNLYYSYVKLLAEHTGYSEDEMHSILGVKFRKVEKVDEKTGEVFTYIRSTSAMNKLQMADMVTEIQKWCESTFKFRLPLPDENWQITFLE